MAHSRTSANAQGLPRRREELWALLLRITMTMDSLTFLSPTTACNSISSITTETAPLRNARSKVVQRSPLTASLSPAWAPFFKITITMGDRIFLVTELPREIYLLYHNEGDGLFSNRSLETGLGA